MIRSPVHPVVYLFRLRLARDAVTHRHKVDVREAEIQPLAVGVDAADIAPFRLVPEKRVVLLAGDCRIAAVFLRYVARLFRLRALPVLRVIVSLKIVDIGVRQQRSVKVCVFVRGHIAERLMHVPIVGGHARRGAVLGGIVDGHDARLAAERVHHVTHRLIHFVLNGLPLRVGKI